ncbi:PucR family transcriptional regulator ligand-binding domain-containing protein [Corynebacterium flavescens]|uniref:PucR family transcriptional regulator ligand-binding domain-containing protein n=1 Tax=Corynebacterium flavescens TaxID=28028 RepID=UPI003FCFEB95
MGSIGLKWLYNQRRLDLRPIVEGPTTFTTIQATELEDPTEFTAPGAIILTVGLAFNGAAAGFPAYAARLKAAGIQGIGFGTGLGFRTIPQQLIAAAQQEGLALFEVPRAIAFNSIINTVSSELVRSENNQQFALHRRQEALNKAAAFGIDHLVAQASQELDAAIALAASDGTTISSHPRHSLDALPDAISVATDPEASTSGAQSRTLKDGTTVATITNAFRIQEHQRFGLAASAPLKFDSYARALVRHLVGLAGLLLRESDSSRQHTLGGLALAAQLSSPALAPSLRAQLAQAFGTIAREENVVYCLISAESPSALDKALHSLAGHAAATGTSYFSLPLDPERSPTASPAPSPEVPGTPSAASQVLLAFSPDTRIATMPQLFGRASSSLRGAHTAAVHWSELSSDLLSALRIQAQTEPLGTAAQLDDLGPVWLNNSAVRSALDARYATLLGELDAYDAAHATELLPTLRAFLLADAHLTHTSAELGVHRHTVRSRIEKIQQLCAIDLSDPITRAEVLLLCISPRAGR